MHQSDRCRTKPGIPRSVIPAKAGIHASINAFNVSCLARPRSEFLLASSTWRLAWIPAFAGMTFECGGAAVPLFGPTNRPAPG